MTRAALIAVLALLPMGDNARTVMHAASCAPFVPYKIQGVLPQGDYELQVTVWFRHPEVVRRLCADGKNMSSAACWLPEERRIIVPAPRDFNDTVGLCLLGHEIYHSMGATHD